MDWMINHLLVEDATIGERKDEDDSGGGLITCPCVRDDVPHLVHL